MPDIFTTNNTTSDPATSRERHFHHLASFCARPLGMHFQNQEEDEQILLFLRRHFITNIPWIFTVIILLILPFLIFPILNSFEFNLVNLPPSFMLVLLIFYYLLVFTFAFIEFITWFYNISIVTQKRVIDIDYSDLVYHDIAVTKLSLVEDVRYVQSGFIGSLFNFGNVFVQTAGESENFEFLRIPKPADAVNIIQNLIGRGTHHV